jgi:hypothetical protein
MTHYQNNPVPGSITGPPFLGVINTGTWPSRLGESQWDSKIMSWVLRDFDPRVTALARPRSNSTVNYRPVLSSERAIQKRNTQMSNGNFRKKIKLVKGPRWAPDTKTDWPSDCRSWINFNFNFNFNLPELDLDTDTELVHGSLNVVLWGRNL